MVYMKYRKSDGIVLSLSTNPLIPNDDEVGLVDFLEVEREFGELSEKITDLKVENEKLVEVVNLDYYKTIKDKELNDACNKSIQSGFDHEINGMTYHFSFDTEAQLNYQGADRLLSSGMVETIDFTVFVDGGYERISVNNQEMQGITLAVLKHKASNISKYRDTLMPIVKNATTKEEILAVKW